MIRINKNNLIYHSFAMEEKPQFVEVEDLMEYLSDEVKIGKGVTFKRIFDLMIIHQDFLNIIFARKTLGYYKIQDYIAEYMKEDDDETANEIDYLEACWHSEYWNFDGDKELSCYSAFHGIREKFTDKYQKEPCRMGMGLDFTPINHWKKYVVKIDNTIKYNDFIKDGKTAEERHPLLVEGKRDLKLFDLFQCILHEISFYGLPKDRDTKRDELNETSRRIDSGEEKLYELKFDDDGKIIWEDYVEDDTDEDECGCGGTCDCDD